VEDIRGYVADGVFEEKVPSLLMQWANNAQRKNNG
jgi:hypothetical protein